MNPLLMIENASKSYGKKEKQHLVLNHLSFSVKEGEFVAIMGPSGSGKTTLLNCISAIEVLNQGHIYFDDKDLGKMKKKELPTFRRKNIGFIFQEFNLLDTLTAYENIALTLSIHKEKDISRKIQTIAKKMNIQDFINQYPYQLSGGQKQRVATARALVTNPKIILADEPTGALDSKSAKNILEHMVFLNKQLHTTILMVTHDIFSACYANRILFMKEGKIVSELHRKNLTNKQFLLEIMKKIYVFEGDEEHVS